jgi:serine/threonine-protein kinase
VPANVDAAIRRALEKLPADRFSGAQELAKALGDPGFRHGEELAAGTASARGQWNPLSMATGALALVFGVVLAWSLLRPEPPKPVERFAVETYSGPGQMGVPSLLPDGPGWSTARAS